MRAVIGGCGCITTAPVCSIAATQLSAGKAVKSAVPMTAAGPKNGTGRPTAAIEPSGISTMTMERDETFGGATMMSPISLAE